ncbi:MAG: dihydrolipoamide acetyltransferase family protein [Capsulimonadales bacterium]|nr:dihydrolipoamide acetyltransferase family protein [Capsulimonadales bacterium]
MADIILPKMGDAMEEGVIVQWLKKVGDQVGPEDAVVEIETDKSNVEVPAGATGFIQSISAEPGQTIPVGQVIAVIGAEAPTGDRAANTAPVAPAAPAGATPKSGDAETTADKAPPQNLSGEGKMAVETATPATNGAEPAPTGKPAEAPRTKPASGWKPYDSFIGALPENLGGSASILGEPIEMETAGVGGERVKASPLARAMAQKNNLDLAQVRGSGPDGNIVKRDIEAMLANGASRPAPADASANLSGYGQPAGSASTPAPAKAAPTPVAVGEGDEVQEYNAMRRTIAKRLLESKTTIPHFYVSAEIDMEALLELREKVNQTAGDRQPKVSVNDCLIKAVGVALAENPKINAIFSDNRRILRKGIHVGFGVALEDGLIVPVVRNADAKSLRAIAKETKPLIEKARAGKLTPAEYTGGTFTVSNMGVLPDIEDFAAIINPGEGAILAVASTRLVPAVVDGQVVPRKRMKVTLSADHRVVDGADGANFLVTLKRVIENPLDLVA